MAAPEIAVAASFVKLVAEDNRLSQADREILLMAVRILREISEREEIDDDGP